MKINIKATGIELTESIRNYAEKKISSVEKYIGDNESVVVQVEVGKTTKHHKGGDVFRAEVKISGGGLNTYAASEAVDLYAAIDLVESEVVREILHTKGRQLSLMRRGERMIKDMMRGLKNPFKK